MNVMQLKTPEERKAIAAKRNVTRQKNLALKRKIQEEAKLKVFGLSDEIKILEEKLSKLKKLELFCKVSAEITNKTLLSADEIVKSSQSWDKAMGVYFLIDQNEIVYVGQSVNIYSRITQHAVDKIFDRYAFVPCLKEHLDKLESLYIHFLQPKLNGFNTNGIIAAPLKLSDLLGI